ncbi:MAG TPA: ECF-type sigma factor [Tepidisphaeraceae bacterium]|nr:ECF-type sigma factor [Tepidisphaeraceae bacterium]
MGSDGAQDIQLLLADVNAGKPGSTDALAAAVHSDLRAMARRHLAKDFGAGMAGITIQPTILANDTLLKLIRQRQAYDNAGHLFAIASRLMLRVLLDYHRERKAQKRGGGAARLSLDPDAPLAASGDGPGSGGGDVDVEAVGNAIDKLAALDARKADVVKYRVLWGLTVPEVANALGVGRATVERDWAFAKAWLAKELAALNV